MEPYSSDDIKRKKRKNRFGLNRLIGRIPGVTSIFVVSDEGFPIAYALPLGTDETKIAAMTAALLSLSERAIIEMGKGDFDQLYIKGSEGYLLVMQAGQNAVLAISTIKDVRLGLILLDCRRVCEKIAQILTDFDGGYFDNDDDDDDDDDDDRYPYPYIFKPKEPPEDLGVETQVQVKRPIFKEPENEKVCQYCGRKLTEEEMVSHNCRKRP